MIKKLTQFVVKTLRKHHINSLALFAFFVPVFSFSATPVLENDVIANLNTTVEANYDNKKVSFDTEKITVFGALVENGIVLEGNDVTYPEKDTVLKGGTFAVEVKRAVPIALDDNSKKSYLFSGYVEADKILKQNNVKLYPEDKVEDSEINETYEGKNVRQKIIIKRAPVVRLTVDGETKEFRTWAASIMDVIKEKQILISEKDKIEPSSASAITDNLSVVITRVAESEVKENEIIAYAEQIVEDDNTFIGKDYVKQAGQNGTKENTFKLISENGELVSKTLINSEVIKNPITQVKVKGTKPYDATNLWPTIVAASSQFGVSASKMHSVMMCESHGNPYAGSFYKGLFQYHPDTWAGASSQYPGGAYKGASIFDPTAQIYVTAWKVSRGGWGAWGCA